MTSKMIQKEEIENYLIVPASEDKSSTLIKDLEYAVRLGNEYKGKTIITFQSSEGPLTVETTVWSVTENNIQLKGGITIPLSSIIMVSF
ncbi:hypothetical protein DBR32_09400 [Taibaiella sp. KBW10]|uniref:hypothetical protein n=1 Tax=Taibaiella sp. KBW10 TaxID=2153357 RepID=UPI000F5A58A6|nr:hypothetical protein [Taibaiella sp. KBW10]RQO30916.1 hypothetical protein DBR32_09400 [Taibaiella sp. KBW10]